MLFSVRLPLAIALSLFLLSLIGCGEKTVVASGSTKSEQSQACIDCHRSVISPVTGALIVEEWKLSHHNTFNGAGCADCHDPEPGHPTGCTLCHGGTPTAPSDHVSSNPDRDGKCYKCHAATNGLFPASGTRGAHFNNSTSVKYPASYVSSKYENNCRACHNPHDTTTAMVRAREWAKSGHGDLTAGARTGNDFKTLGSYRDAQDEFTDSISPSAAFPNAANRSVCVRCHTSTGYIRYVTTNFTRLEPFAGKPEQVVQYNAVAAGLFAIKELGTVPGSSSFGKASDRLANTISKLSPDFSREATHCNVCHDDGKGNAYGFKLRNVNIGSGTITYFNYSGQPGSGIKKSIRNNKITFPDAGASNMCVSCHAGRENGDVIKLADANGIDFTKTGRVGAHDFVAASDLFRKSGFHFYSSARQYQSDFAHDIIGLKQQRILFNGTAAFDGLNADSRGYGPCIGCHVNSDASHSFRPVNAETGSIDGFIDPPIKTVISRACANCHTGNFTWTTETLQAKKEGYYFAIKAVEGIIKYVALPTSSSTLSNWITGPSIKAWLKPPPPVPPAVASDPLAKYASQNKLRLAAYNMGAVFNQTVLAGDPGGFAHNSVYVKRLIYDSIDWLDNGQLDRSVNATFTHMATAKDANGVTFIINATPAPNTSGTPYSFSFKPGATTFTTLQSYLNSLTTDDTGWQKAYDWLLVDSNGKRP